MDINKENVIFNDTGLHRFDRYEKESKQSSRIHPLLLNRLTDDDRSDLDRRKDGRYLVESIHQVEKDFIFNPTNLLSCIIPVVYISKALGLVCFSVVRENNHTKLTTSCFGSVYNYAMIIAQIILGVISWMNYKCLDKLSNATDLYLLVGLVSMWTPIVKLLLYLIWVQKQQSIMENIYGLHDIDVKMKQCNIEIPHGRNQRMMMIPFLLKILIVLLTSITAFVIPVEEHEHVFYINVVMLFAMVEFMNSMAECQFLFWMLALRQRFHLLNSRLSESGHNDLVLVQNLSDIHASLVKSTEKTVSLYKFQLVYTITAYFLQILMWSYTTILNGVLSEGEIPLLHCLHSLSFLICCIVNTAIVCGCSGSVCNEARSTGACVSQALRKASNTVITEKLRDFSAQLLHQQLHVSACGFFDINMNLLYCMVGGVTTYLVILVQFELAGQKSDKPATTDSNSTTRQ